MTQAERALFEHRFATRQNLVGRVRHVAEITESTVQTAGYCSMPVPAAVIAAAEALTDWAESVHATIQRERAERGRTGMDGAAQQRQLERAIYAAGRRAQDG